MVIAPGGAVLVAQIAKDASDNARPRAAARGDRASASPAAESAIIRPMATTFESGRARAVRRHRDRDRARARRAGRRRDGGRDPRGDEDGARGDRRARRRRPPSSRSRSATRSTRVSCSPCSQPGEPAQPAPTPHAERVGRRATREDLEAVIARHALTLDDARPDAVAKRHERGRRTRPREPRRPRRRGHVRRVRAADVRRPGATAGPRRS